MGNSDQQLSCFIPCSDIIRPVFPHKVKPIKPRNSPSKSLPNNSPHKDGNILLEKSKGILNSLPKVREDTEFRKKYTTLHIKDVPLKKINRDT